MNKIPLPSLGTTFRKSLGLFFQTYFTLFPLVLLGAAFQYFFQKQFSIQIVTPDGHFVKEGLFALIILVSFGLLLISVVQAGMYSLYYQKGFNYADVIKKGLYRFFPLLNSTLILMLGLFLSAIILGIFISLLCALLIYFLPKATPIFTAFIILFDIVLVLYFWSAIYVKSVLIVNESYSSWEGLKRSWALTKQYRLDTLLIILLLCLPIAIISFTIYKLWGQTVLNVFQYLTTSLGVAFTIIHCEHLKKVREN